MSILDRLSTLMKSNLNDLIDKMQDPGKEIDQLVRDMDDSIRQARAEVAASVAEEKRLARQADDSQAAQAVTWDEQAARAARSGDDALAREALQRKAQKEADKLEVERARAEQETGITNLLAGLRALELRTKEVKLRQGTLRERARAAKGQSPLAGGAAFADFERMSSRIDALEAEAGLTDELQRTAEERASERKLERMSEAKGLDDALAALKKKLE